MSPDLASDDDASERASDERLSANLIEHEEDELPGEDIFPWGLDGNMRITIGRPDWLASTAIALVLTIPGTLASGGNTFINFTKGFESSFPASGSPFISYNDARLRVFEWEANNVVVQKVRLFSSSGGDDYNEIGYGERSTDSGSALLEGAETSSTTDNGLPSETPSWQDGVNNGALGRRMPQWDRRYTDSQAPLKLTGAF